MSERRPISRNNDKNISQNNNKRVLSHYNIRKNIQDNKVSFNKIIVSQTNPDKKIISIENFRDFQRNSNLHIAVKMDSIKLVRYFLSKKHNINDINKKGETPLHIACKLCNYEIINLLIEHGAQKEIKDNLGRQPFDLTSKGCKDYIKIRQLFIN
jgi:ankyrin repeat protein